MNIWILPWTRRAAVLLVLAASSLGTPGVTQASEVEDRPLAPFQNELLDLAYRTAAAIPTEPHIKDRCKAIEAVVSTCLELDQPGLAMRFTEGITNWRRGMCHAQLALYFSRKGLREQAQKQVESAKANTKATQDWQTARVDQAIARAELWLKGAGAPGAELVKRELNEGGTLSDQIDSLKSDPRKDDFETVKNSLDVMIDLFDMHFSDPESRAMVETKIKSRLDGLPPFIRIDLLSRLAESSLKHSDREKTLTLAEEAQIILNGYEWPIEARIPMTSRLIALRARAGGGAELKGEADSLRSLFAEKGGEIVNIYKAEALRPLAEACQAMGDKDSVLSVYRQVVEMGMENPNSRPRAEDLSATCCSLALHGVEPEAELRARLQEIHSGLRPPW